MRARSPLFRSIRKNGNLGGTALSGRRCMRQSAAAPPWPGTTRTSSPNSVGTRCGPGSSPRPSATAPTRTRSCARPGTSGDRGDLRAGERPADRQRRH
ncbi:putative integrase/recombinase (plasmid) [Rhodococcus opacus B4]|uniref:Putative integrase/recombinase n=1 Tax=Rhodococcus opacus (strain B4) TaxID=632772 RepID=C1BE23_RHOOB|nr:putative integrase/recombinase [Rhodococcus opacus B4]